MSIKKALALAGLFLILGAGFALAQGQAQAAEANKVQTKVSSQNRVRTMFMDQDGDGINDFQRDHDNDGIPNCQDSDWTKPQDGTGYKNQFGRKGPESQFGNRKGFQGGQEWSNSSFRKGQGGLGGGVCDGTGPKGAGMRKGRS
jgi:hypothetical protein